MDIILYILVFISVALSVVSVVLLVKKNGATLSKEDKQDISSSLGNQLNISNNSFNLQLSNFQNTLSQSQKDLEERVEKLSKNLDERMQQMSKAQEEKLEAIRQSNERNIKNLQEDNNKQLDKMRETVDEKLSKTINERFDQSFKVLADQLDKVSKSIGEMQTIASDVGNLNKMLSNVKTTGNFGELRLDAILSQLLAKDQYETNVVTAEGRDPVEYAIKYPDYATGESIYLPIDSKFPLKVYQDMKEASDAGNAELYEQKKRQLVATIKNMAKDISTKYIYPPKTTDFAIMFLPFEGLYADVVKIDDLLAELQTKYRVIVTGPTTMCALINSLQMGFKTVKLQKKSAEIQNVLRAVSTEFDKFSEVVQKIQDKFKSTEGEFEKLVGTRTRMLASKLKNIDRLDDASATKILQLVDDVDSSEDK
ncbi:MAG: DNA recombination protein RmuC [Clostridia bacterium]|nr:DNA recombination protein RmuC [Clostridia bacterium]